MMIVSRLDEAFFFSLTVEVVLMGYDLKLSHKSKVHFPGSLFNLSSHGRA